MTNINPKKVKQIRIFKAKDALSELGISQATLSRWSKSGKVKRLARGIYVTDDVQFNADKLDFIVACARFGEHSAIAGLSALSYYGLIEQIPNQLWVVTTPNIKNETYKKKYRVIRTQVDLKHGVEQKHYYKITSLERTLVESLKHSTKIGLNIVLKAIRKALKNGLTTEIKLGEMAKKLHMENTLKRHWQSIV